MRPVLFVSALLLVASGCANVHVRKVPVEDRACGRDTHTHGFRYYLSRPFIIVSDKIPIADYSETTVLMKMTGRTNGQKKETDSEYVLVSATKAPTDKDYNVYNMSGIKIGQSAEFKLDAIKNTKPPKVMPMPLPEKKVESVAFPVAFNAVGKGPKVVVPVTPTLQQENKAQAPGETKPAPAKLSDVLTVVSLPDFEEQYAISNCSFLAKSKYELHFSDGWALESFGGSWDSTTVTAQLFNTIRNAIDQFAGVQTEAIKMLPHPPGGVRSLEYLNDKYVVTIKRTFYVEPGIYRLQKSWERAARAEVTTPDALSGLFADLGLELRQEISFHLP